MINAILSNLPIELEEAKNFIAALESEELTALADKLRKQVNGQHFSTCMIINAKSGACTENCKWCAQSSQYQTDAPLYSLSSTEEIMKEATIAANHQISRLSLVASGRKLSPKDIDKIASTYKTLNKTHSKVQYCASLGLSTEEELKKLYEAGVSRYHCNLETATSFFPQLCTTHTIDDKIKTIRLAQKVGMTICSGGIIGMGETEEQRIEMALMLRDLQVDSIPINILIPIKGTSMEKNNPLTTEEIGRAYAIFKIFNPTAEVRFAAGRALIKDDLDSIIKNGISAALVGNMLTTVGISLEDDLNYFKTKRELI